MIERAETLRLAGEFDAAAAVFRDVLDGSDTLGAARHARALGGLGRTLADRLNDTGSALFRLGRLDQAVKRLEEALALRRGLDRVA
ncbi:MAG TPA: tetratricopeptide repeat protein [Wenzhouxiangellaceae bacterium]|nr:tetratricopeptide repeat protein [Wenzhouxiangellaceae bacterium]